MDGVGCRIDRPNDPAGKSTTTLLLDVGWILDTASQIYQQPLLLLYTVVLSTMDPIGSDLLLFSLKDTAGKKVTTL